VPTPADDTRVRLAELLAALSLGVDLGFNQPMEHVLRQSLIALRISDLLGLADDERFVVYHTSLLVNVACHSDAHEQAKWFGDDIAVKATKYTHGLHGVKSAVGSLKFMGGVGRPMMERFRIGLQFAAWGHKEVDQMVQHHSRLARAFAEELGLPTEVAEAVDGSYEQWDGKGWPGDLKGEDVPLASRITQVAEFVEAAFRAGGLDAAIGIARKQAGKQFDPKLADMVVTNPEDILGGLDEINTWSVVIDGEPSLSIPLTEDEFDQALTAIANFVDLKSPYTLGHSAAVAELAAAAAAQLDMSADEQRLLRRSGLVIGFGRLGVSNAIWDKPGPLGTGEWERIRLHPYFTQRMLSQSPKLAELSAIAVQYRERLDGSGYPGGLRAGAISRPARVLAASDAYRSMREPRPYRESLTDEEAATELRSEVTAGRLDGDAVDAVLAVAGHRVPRRRDAAAGLTTREVEVLRLVARGLTNKAIAQQLVISPKTAGNHVEHIYTKIGASNRAAASLFAMQQGLLTD